jgi:hypothetical protein
MNWLEEKDSQFFGLMLMKRSARLEVQEYEMQRARRKKK